MKRLSVLLLAGCATPRDLPPESASLSKLEAFVTSADLAGYLHDNHEVRITLPTPEIVETLERYRAEGRTEHLPLLVEYGLKLHWLDLRESGLARELRVKDNAMLRELVRLAEIPELRDAHDGGWLEVQFDGYFRGGGWSTYQIYLCAKEQYFHFTDDSPCAERIRALLRQIDASGRSGVGGDGRCHYGCA